MTRPPVVGVGDVVEVDEQHYCYGLGRLTLRVIEVGLRERHSDGIWLHLRGVELGRPAGPRQRRVLVRLEAIRVRPDGRQAQLAGSRKEPAHIPVRPGWTCGGCGRDWPCPERRRRLLLGYGHDRAALAVYLGCHLADATLDLPDLTARELYARFLGWLPRRRAGAWDDSQAEGEEGEAGEAPVTDPGDEQR